MDQLSWFKYEELFYSWLDSTVLGAGKQGAALKIRPVGDAEMYKGTSQSRISENRRWSQVFKDALRPHFINGAQSNFLWIISI